MALGATGVGRNTVEGTADVCVCKIVVPVGGGETVPVVEVVEPVCDDLGACAVDEDMDVDDDDDDGGGTCCSTVGDEESPFTDDA